MKSVSQVLEKRVHQIARRKVRSSVQPGVVWNILESEISSVLTEIVQERLRHEQDQALGRQVYERSRDPRRRNGFKRVRLGGLLRGLWVKKPVLRRGTPPSALLDAFRNFGHGLFSALASRFWLRGASTRAVAQELNNTFGTKVSATDVSHITESVIPAVDAWMNRPVPEGIRFLFLDALYLPVRKPGFTTKQALLAAVGVTANGSKHVLGFLLGDRENHESWSALIKDLLNRGLKRDVLGLVLSDDHKAIRSAVDQTLGVPHQLCVVHKMRNALARVSAPNRKEFYRDFTRVYWAKSKDLALLALGELRGRWEPVYPKAVAIATAEPENFLRFMDFPTTLWTTLRSTNLIERFNRELRRRLRPAGALPTEIALWKLVWSISQEQEKRWSRAPHWQQPRVISKALAA